MDEEFYEDEFDDEDDGLYDDEEENHVVAQTEEQAEDESGESEHLQPEEPVKKANPVMEMLAEDTAPVGQKRKEETAVSNVNPKETVQSAAAGSSEPRQPATSGDTRENLGRENRKETHTGEHRAEKQEPGKSAGDLPPEEFIARTETEYLNQNPNVESWHELRSQLRSALRLGISQNQLAAFINDKYSYEQREVLKYFLFIRVPDKLLSEISPNMKPSEMATHYDLYRAEGTFAGMIDGPLNSMSKMVETYREDMSRFRMQAEKEMQKLKEEIAQREAEIAKKENEIQSLTDQIKIEKERAVEERKKQEEQERIRRTAEQMAKEMIQKEKSDNDRFEEKVNQEVKRRTGVAHVPSTGVTGAVVQSELKADKEKKKRKRFGKKKKEAEEVKRPVITTKPGDLPADFDISTYMLNSDLTSSQMDVISFAVKCNVPDWTVKDMIDSNKDSQQLKQFLEVVLARRDREIAGSAQEETTEEDIIYDDETEE